MVNNKYMHASSFISKPLILIIVTIIIIIIISITISLIVIGIGLVLVTGLLDSRLEQKHLAIHRKYLHTISNQNLSVEKIKQLELHLLLLHGFDK